ncbi:MAG TPA: transglutaminase domain-containing protein [Phycisphaerae bacterium]|nr:transglutaminase domain-containing protein [Phycisphaerae bacterium]HNU44676.1 transglutaminase domain-containing protein [Phycisphaerae bacterium]
MSSRWAVLVLVVGVAVSSHWGAYAGVAPGDATATLDIPCKYPAGLASDGKHLYLADWRAAKLFELDPADGRVVRSWDAPTLKPAGLAFGDGRFFVSDDHTGLILVTTPGTGAVLTRFEAPGTQAVGLAYGDGVLFILEGKSRKIYRVVPEDGTILGYFDVPEAGCTSMTYVDGYLWVANRVKDELYMVRAETGKVVNVLPAPGPYAAGLAAGENCLWNVDFQTRKLYCLALSGDQRYRLSETREARVEYLWALNNYGPGEVRDLVVNVAVPDSLPNQEILSELQYSMPPTRVAADQWGQVCAIFELGQVPAGRKQLFTYSVPVRVSAIRYLIVPEQTGTLDDIPADLRTRYTLDGSRYRVSSPYIQETVKKIVGDERNCYWIARKIYDYLIDRLEYEMVGGWDVPEVVLKRGTGSCSEYTFSFVALCRAAGLPARYQGSVVVRGDDASVDEAFHRWAQVYLPNYGWVPVDANHGDTKGPADQARGFGGLTNRFLITTHGGGDSEYLSWGYNSFSRYETSGYCKIEEDNFACWEPLAKESAEKLQLPGRPGTADECEH